jgi:hypothetical protein
LPFLEPPVSRHETQFFILCTCIKTDIILQNLDDNLGALRLTLPAEDIAEIRRLAQAVDGNIGERNLPLGLKMSFVDTPPLA